ncbi:Uncharacterised protein [Mycobacteroides abscessus subsp. abscessus]|nr:Uncharacterised protein [Mycobacteroides abscessus subsp. abscessus]
MPGQHGHGGGQQRCAGVVEQLTGAAQVQQRRAVLVEVGAHRPYVTAARDPSEEHGVLGRLIADAGGVFDHHLPVDDVHPATHIQGDQARLGPALGQFLRV